MACEYGMVHVVSESGGPRGKDYCILYNPQWAHLPHDLSKAVSTHWGVPSGALQARSALGCPLLTWGPVCVAGCHPLLPSLLSEGTATSLSLQGTSWRTEEVPQLGNQRGGPGHT